MKNLIILLILAPLFSFGQLSKKEKQSVENYLYNTCECVNDVMNELHPKVHDVIVLMAEKSEEEALQEVEAMIAKMSPEEIQDFGLSFQKMESADFGEKIDNCESTESVGKEIMKQIDSSDGPAFDYLLDYMAREKACELTKTLYDYGVESEE